MTAKRRIALVTQGFATGGGVPTVVAWLQKGIDSTPGLEAAIVDLATSRRDPTSRRAASPRTWFRPSLRGQLGPVEHWGSNMVELERMRYRPRRELTERLDEFDLIQVVSGGPALGAVAAHTKRPVVLQMATFLHWERAAIVRRRSWRSAYESVNLKALRAVERHALDIASTVAVENRAAARYVASLSATPVHVAPPGVDTDYFAPNPSGWQARGPILCISRLSDPRKGLDRLVDAYGALKARRSSCPPLTIAGKGSPTGELVRAIERSPVSRDIRLIQDVENVKRLLTQASVFVQTSHEEGFGIAVAEAMACGLPVVATTTAGTCETVDSGRTGYLIDQGVDLPTQFTEACLAVLDSQGPHMHLAARERAVSLFSSQRCFDRFLDIYMYLLDGTNV